MKAAVLKAYGSLPVCETIELEKRDTQNAMEVFPILSSIKQLDILKAKGAHYTNFGKLPAIMGMDGVAKTLDGRRIYAMGLTGMMAERAFVDKTQMIELPDNLSDEVAAALPNDLIGSDLALREKAEIKKGDIIFINGATGATGTLAVQMAKFHEASKIIVTGRNEAALEKLKTLGADLTISLKENDETIQQAVQKAYNDSPFDSVIDYLWGRPAELILNALTKVKMTKQLRFVTVGEMAGHTITLSSEILRSKNILFLGSGIGSNPPELLGRYMGQVLPEIFAYAAKHPIYMNKPIFNLSDIERAWSQGIALIKIGK